MRSFSLTCWLLLLLLGCSALGAPRARAQGRITQSINANWLFCRGAGPGDAQLPAPAANWEKISLPHTWNATDVADDVPGYYRGVGWYKRTIFVPQSWAQRPVYLYFEGAGQEAEVYVNGHLAGRHAGGYTAFSFAVGRWLHFGAGETANELVVRVNNRANPDLPPLSADFTFYGGLYRDVYLVAAEPVHFDLADYASSGLFVSTPRVSAAAAEVMVRGAVTNDAATAQRVRVRTQLLDHDGRVVAEQYTALLLKAGQKRPFTQAFQPVRQPHLWSPADPYLYRVVSTVQGPDGAARDAVSSPLGLRWFRFDAATGFYLNGQPLKLIGTSRHQDYPGLGNALPDALAAHDVQLLKQMGGNFLRVAHYPQDPAVLAACDRLGILASVEIPVVNAITDSEAFFRACDTMQTEMIRQSYNHPSVIIWAYMNEVLLRLPTGLTATNAAGQAYLGRVAALARRLDALTRREDPARATMLVCHGNFDLYRQAGLLAIPQVVGWNLYAGWYSPRLQDFPDFLDRHRRELPDKPLLVTEYGADADARLHAWRPQRFDKTTEYANAYHAFYLQALLARPFVAGGAVWNLAEFNSESRQEANPHLNTKSVLTADRQPKDAYLFYQAHLLQTPFIKIGSRAWTLRAGPAQGPDSLFCPQPVDVYTNQPAVQLRLNGQALGTQPAVFGVAHFRVPFGPGLNQLTAQASGQLIDDQATIEFQLLPPNLASQQLPFTELNVSLGDERYFTDAKLHQVWVPEQAYAPGGWGYVGGHAYVLPDKHLPYGSDRDILGTDYDALYETQRVGLRQFRLDVPAGQYEVTLHFAELEAAPPAERLVYNLGQGPAAAAPPTAAARVFDVRLNGTLVLTDLGPATYLAPLQATSFKLPLTVAAGQGIVLDFEAKAGEAVLNAIQVKRVD